MKVGFEYHQTFPQLPKVEQFWKRAKLRRSSTFWTNLRIMRGIANPRFVPLFRWPSRYRTLKTPSCCEHRGRVSVSTHTIKNEQSMHRKFAREELFGHGEMQKKVGKHAPTCRIRTRVRASGTVFCGEISLWVSRPPKSAKMSPKSENIPKTKNKQEHTRTTTINENNNNNNTTSKTEHTKPNTKRITSNNSNNKQTNRRQNKRHPSIGTAFVSDFGVWGHPTFGRLKPPCLEPDLSSSRHMRSWTGCPSVAALISRCSSEMPLRHVKGRSATAHRTCHWCRFGPWVCVPLVATGGSGVERWGLKEEQKEETTKGNNKKMKNKGKYKDKTKRENEKKENTNKQKGGTQNGETHKHITKTKNDKKNRKNRQTHSKNYVNKKHTRNIQQHEKTNNTKHKNKQEQAK